MTGIIVRRALTSTLLAGLLAGLSFPVLTGHAASRLQTASPHIIVNSKTFAVTLPKSIPAGMVTLSMTGAGQPWTGASLGRLKTGASHTAVVNALKKADYARLETLGVPYGGVSAAGTMTMNLPAGQYVVFDTEQQNPKSPVLYASKFFTVGPANGPAAVAPAAIATITMDDMRFKVPASLPAGRDTIKMSNPDQVEHMAVLVKIAAGKTYKDVLAFIKKGDNSSGPGPVDPSTFGGINTMGPGQTAYLTQSFSPGEYVIMCFVSDPKKGGIPHVAEGMVNHFTVR